MSRFSVQRITDPTLLHDFLDRRRDAYMVGDLAEPYWSNAEFYGAFEGSLLQGVVLKYKPIDPPPMISAGNAEAVAAIYTHLADTTPALFYHAANEHLDAIRAHYRINEGKQLEHYRMICTAEAFTPLDDPRPRRLNAVDWPDLENLMQPPPEILSSMPFYGIAEGDQLIAMAGTHIFSPETGIGVVGWVYTHPDYRGRGYAARCTSAVTSEFFREGLTLAALNVRQDNAPAIRAYTKLGFAINNTLWEGEAQHIS
jgi:ribosomal protein S18 acetylase RimI-like enzyme